VQKREELLLPMSTACPVIVAQLDREQVARSGARTGEQNLERSELNGPVSARDGPILAKVGQFVFGSPTRRAASRLVQVQDH